MRKRWHVRAFWAIVRGKCSSSCWLLHCATSCWGARKGKKGKGMKKSKVEHGQSMQRKTRKEVKEQHELASKGSRREREREQGEGKRSMKSICGSYLKCNTHFINDAIANRWLLNHCSPLPLLLFLPPALTPVFAYPLSPLLLYWQHDLPISAQHKTRKQQKNVTIFICFQLNAI